MVVSLEPEYLQMFGVSEVMSNDPWGIGFEMKTAFETTITDIDTSVCSGYYSMHYELGSFVT